MATSKEIKLTPKKKRFCQEYVKDLNGKQAAIRSGYSIKTAENQASRLLRSVKVKEYIKKLQKDIRERNKMNVDDCVQMLSLMSKFDVADIFNDDGTMKLLKDIPKDTRLVIEGLDIDEIKDGPVTVGYTKKLKLSSRRANIIELMKHLGGYEKDNNQKESNNVVIFNIPDNGRG
ncbi:terminase small subunit [Changchengzhania lutea]|uniref:terminase small subunit n=1 Tax=Changchengzhania lutea TaxID=2049305 RepID=UPI00115D5404|nr:terminase small subunit [Changchengzhania lutea]